jgi:ribosome assembly protein YihI (activator of Der GTPase)
MSVQELTEQRMEELENLAQMFLDAEEELRQGNDEKCLELKDAFSEECKDLNQEERQYVDDYLMSLGA